MVISRNPKRFKNGKIMDKNNALKFIRLSCRIICHQIPERCFSYKGYLFPVCARCTGIIISFVLSLSLLFCNIFINWKLALLMLLIMCVDWLIQYIKIKESTNKRRFITGVIGGFGLSYTFYYFVKLFMNFLT